MDQPGQPKDASGAPLWRTMLGNLRLGVLAGCLAGLTVGVVELAIDLHISDFAHHFLHQTGFFVRFLPTVLTLMLFFGALGGLAQGVLLAVLLPRHSLRWLVESADENSAPRHWALTPHLWAIWITSGLFIVVLQRRIFRILVTHADNVKDLTARLSAITALELVAVLALLYLLVVRGVRWLGPRLGGLGSANPFEAPLAALVLLNGPLVIAGGVLVYIIGPRLEANHWLHVMAQAYPWRLTVPFALLAVSDLIWLRLLAGGLRLYPLGQPRRKRAQWITAGAVTVIGGLSLVYWGGRQDVKLTLVASPTLNLTVEMVRFANDFDRDGFGSLLGENDCAPFNAKIHPGAVDIPDNGIDENCWGGDFSAKALANLPPGKSVPVPEEFRKDYNVLLITIDTVRYDHTGFGGYKQRTPDHRDTTPNLDKFVDESVSFTDANAPSTGTMASMPAILTSKFFHSGIALGPERVGKGPMILPENFLIGEMMKKAGYYTGAIVTHDYFVDWGTDQGIDDYDDEIARKPRDAYLVSSPAVTDKALSWIARNGTKKWFLWCHYLDPHGRYVAHPNDKQFGTGTEEDLYDGEIAFTDKHLGRLLDSLRHGPLWANTIVIVTSDHGDGFNEHGFTSHANIPYHELISVPLIVHIPELPARISDQVATPLDIMPTLSEIVGAPIGRPVEGHSLVGPIFYGSKANDNARVVFSETNLPVPIRVAVDKNFKLIANLRSNTYQLYDRNADPGEKNNIYTQNTIAAERMKKEIDGWLERVFAARDASNQSFQKVREDILAEPPKTMTPASAKWMNAIELIGYEVTPKSAHPGDKLTVTCYFRSIRTIAQSLRMEVWVEAEAMPQAPGDKNPPPVPPMTNAGIIFGAGFNLTSSWHPGDIIRQAIEINVPSNAPPSHVNLIVKLTDDANNRQAVPLSSAPGVDGVLGPLSVGGQTLVAPAPLPAPPKPVIPPANPIPSRKPPVKKP